MGKIRKKVILLAILLIISFLGKGNAELILMDPIDYSSPPVKAFIATQNVFKNERYAEAWNCFSEHVKKNDFNGDFNNFRKWTIENPDFRQAFSTAEIEKIWTISVKKIIVEVNSNQLENSFFYVIKEGGEWKISTPARYDIGKAIVDLEVLSNAIQNYYVDKKKLPDELSQLVPAFIKNLPFDPFNDKNKPYVYTVAGNTWELYSFGPDGDDDLGLFAADLNVIFSNGDIIKQNTIY